MPLVCSTLPEVYFSQQAYSGLKGRRDASSLSAIRGCVGGSGWGAIGAAYWALQWVDGLGPSCQTRLNTVWLIHLVPSTILSDCLQPSDLSPLTPHLPVSHCPLQFIFNFSPVGVLSAHYHFFADSTFCVPNYEYPIFCCGNFKYLSLPQTFCSEKTEQFAAELQCPNSKRTLTEAKMQPGLVLLPDSWDKNYLNKRRRLKPNKAFHINASQQIHIQKKCTIHRLLEMARTALFFFFLSFWAFRPALTVVANYYSTKFDGATSQIYTMSYSTTLW